MKRASEPDWLAGISRNGDRVWRNGSRAGVRRVSARPQMEILDERMLLSASVTLPTGQYLSALEALVPSVVGAEVNDLVSTYDIPGMGVAITYQGSVILDRGYGFTGDSSGADATGTPPVTTSTPFAVGSVSKSFTGIATLMIAQDPALIDTSANPGITSLDLDAPIGTYLPPGVPIALRGLPSSRRCRYVHFADQLGRSDDTRVALDVQRNSGQFRHNPLE
jgi:hypothetical protein